ncbi:MAG: Glutathione import ATP-binding protein GsiA [Pseudomonadota bacterium]
MNANPSQPLLELKDLDVAFAGQSVVHGVNLSIRAGERVALVGESGSGKSVTALSVLRLLESAKLTGQVLWQGRDLLQQSPAEMQRIRGDEIAMIFQEPMTALNPLMTVGQQISEVLQLKKGLTRRDADARAVQWLLDTGIDDPRRRFDAYPHQLSGGQRQRAMMAMAVASEPQLLLADEPTTALDASLRLQMLNLLADLQQKTGMAVLLITHDLALVRHFADHVAVISTRTPKSCWTVDPAGKVWCMCLPILLPSHCSKPKPCGCDTPWRCPACGLGFKKTISRPCTTPTSASCRAAPWV